MIMHSQRYMHFVVTITVTVINMNIYYNALVLSVMRSAELTELRRSALALACLNRGSSFVMVYWCIICSVFDLYTS